MVPSISRWPVFWIQPGWAVKLSRKDKGQNSSPQLEVIVSATSTLITYFEIDYQKDFLSTLSDWSIFTVHYLLWILNVQAIKVADWAYKTTGGKGKGVPKMALVWAKAGINESSKFSLWSLTFHLQFIFLEPRVGTRILTTSGASGDVGSHSIHHAENNFICDLPERVQQREFSNFHLQFGVKAIGDEEEA